ncbi:hypothetical protein MTO96_040300 [Rhipicephalus appendiculatus]
MGQTRATRDSFLWGMSVVYLSAFASIYHQMPGLYGDHGVTPVRSVIPIDSHTKPVQELARIAAERPSLIWLAPNFGLKVATMAEFLAFLGIVMSFMACVSARFRDCINFAPSLDTVLFNLSGWPGVHVVSVGHSAAGSWLPVHTGCTTGHPSSDSRAQPLELASATPSVRRHHPVAGALAPVPLHVCLRGGQTDQWLPHLVESHRLALPLTVTYYESEQCLQNETWAGKLLSRTRHVAADWALEVML